MAAIIEVKYFNSFFECFDNIAQRPFSFESVDYVKQGYRRCVCGSDSIYFRVNKDTNTFTSLTLLSGLAPPVGYSFLYPNDCL